MCPLWGALGNQYRAGNVSLRSVKTREILLPLDIRRRQLGKLLVFTSRALLSQRIRNLLLLSPGDARLPANTLPSRTDLIIQLVNFLQGQALRLVDHGVNEGNAEEAAAEPDEEDLGLQVRVAGSVVDQVRG